MQLKTGYFYFILDDFFEKVNDPYLKIDYKTTKRPHYFAFCDTITSLYWMTPCSTRVEKFETIIQKKHEQHKPTDGIKIVIVRDEKKALLFQDMFPITVNYLKEQYIRAGNPVYIENQKIVTELEKTAKKVITLLHRGIKFTPTQPDINRIERLMMDELREQQKM